MSEALDKVDEYPKQILKELLEQCTENQQVFFKRLYPEGVDEIDNQKVRRAIQQCERTIKNNKENGEKNGI